MIVVYLIVVDKPFYFLSGELSIKSYDKKVQMCFVTVSAFKIKKTSTEQTEGLI